MPLYALKMYCEKKLLRILFFGYDFVADEALTDAQWTDFLHLTIYQLVMVFWRLSASRLTIPSNSPVESQCVK